MTLLADAFTSYSTVGKKESFEDAIFNIAPTDTPFLSMLKRKGVDNIYHQWQTDTLASAANNKALEGDETAATAAVPTVLAANYAQISKKVFAVTGTNQAIAKHGRGKNELSYQAAKNGKELKRDIEFALTQNGTFIAGDATTARQTRGLEGWIATNDVLGTAGSPASPDPSIGGNTAADDGTARQLTESLVREAHRLAYTQGGSPSILMVGPFNRGVVDSFTGYSTRMEDGKDKKLTATINVYVGPFGELKVMTNRFQRDRTAFLLDTDYWSLGVVRPMMKEPLAKTADADKQHILMEYMLISKQEKASGAVRDLTTS